MGNKHDEFTKKYAFSDEEIATFRALPLEKQDELLRSSLEHFARYEASLDDQWNTGVGAAVQRHATALANLDHLLNTLPTAALAAARQPGGHLDLARQEALNACEQINAQRQRYPHQQEPVAFPVPDVDAAISALLAGTPAAFATEARTAHAAALAHKPWFGGKG